jgi:FdhD protein
MTDTTGKYPIYVFEKDMRERVEKDIVIEYSLTIRVNGAELAVLSCSPKELEYLAAGLVQSQGIIRTKDDISDIIVNEDIIDIITANEAEIPAGMMVTSSNGRSNRLIDIHDIRCDSQVTVPAENVYRLMEYFEKYSRDFIKTGGVHSAALCNSEEMLLFSEDIGRHNAIDKVFGRCLLEGIDVGNRFMITSGRVSSDIMMKIARRRVPVLISRNSPTNLGLEIAGKTGITLLGFVRGESMNAYTHAWRVT